MSRLFHFSYVRWVIFYSYSIQFRHHLVRKPILNEMILIKLLLLFLSSINFYTLRYYNNPFTFLIHHAKTDLNISTSIITQNGIFVDCSGPKRSMYICQKHYLLYWDSKEMNFVKSLRESNEDSITYTFHTTFVIYPLSFLYSSISHIRRLFDVIDNWQG